MKYSLVLAMMLVMMAPGGAYGALQEPVGDTLPGQPAPAFRKSLIPNTRHLSRLIAQASRGRVEMNVEVEVDPPDHPAAVVYADRYRISRELAQQILEAAVAEGVDPELAFRLVRVESVFRPRARGPQGALGLTQLMPSTARAIDRSVRTDAQILEPRTNLRLGFRYLRQMIERYDGNVRLGLLAYNRGQTAVDRALRAGRDPENGYSRLVLGPRAGGGDYRGPGLLRSDRR